MQQFRCPVCATPAKGTDRGGGPDVVCPRCGNFEIGHIAAHEISIWKPQQRSNLSGWIREHQACKIVSSDLPGLSTLRTPTFSEKVLRLMLHYAKSHPKPGEYIHASNPSSDLLGICWAEDLEELSFILVKYLIHEQRFLEQTTDRHAKNCLRITTKGWSYLDELLREHRDSQIGFIAMWFDDSMDEAWKAIDQGIRDSGYDALRIDQKQHNNKIHDEIIKVDPIL